MFEESRSSGTEMRQPSLLSVRRLFAAAALDMTLFRRAKGLLEGKQLPDSYVAFEFWFAVLLEHFAEHKQLPTLDMLRHRLIADMDESPGVEDIQEECSELFGMAKTLGAMRTEDALPPSELLLANMTLDEFYEYLVRVDIRQAIGTADLGRLLRESKDQLVAAAATDEDRFASPFAGKLYTQKTGRFIPTGNIIVDAFTGGTGPVTGDVIGHAAPINSGKSTMAAQCAYDVAKMERISAAAEGRQPRWVYLFNYEKIQDPLTHMLVYGAKIIKSTVEQFIYAGDLSDFSREGKYKPYEKAMFASAILRASRGECPFPQTELERLKVVQEQLAYNVMVADFTGGDPALRGMARNFVAGISEYIEAHQERHKNPGVQGVFVDYAGTCARVHMRSLSRVSDHTERKLVEDLPLQLKNDITNQMACFGWIAQQLAADECEKQGGSRPSANRFKDCRSFSENCDFAFVNGILTKDTHLAIAVQSKVRRGEHHPDMIIKLQGAMSHWEMAGNEFAIESDRVINAKEMSRFGAGSSSITPEF
jgi:hypothetical protein